MRALHTIDGARDALWTTTAVAAPETGRLDGDIACDVLVVGGGITGLSAALHLARAGVDVVVAEAERIGYGASGRSGGQVNMGLNDGPEALIRRFGEDRAMRLIELVMGAPDEVFRLIRDHQMNCDAVQNGLIFAAKTPAHRTRLARLADEYNLRGGDCRMLDGPAHEAETGAVGFVGGMRIAACGSVQPLSFTRELARVASDNGARLFDGAPVTGLERSMRGWRVRISGHQVTADTVLLCTNAYSDDLVPGIRQTMIPVRSIQAATEPLSASLRARILPGEVTFVDKRRLVLYVRYDRDGRLCVGDRGPSRDAFSRFDFDGLKSRATKVFPQLADVSWQHHWGGRVAITRDFLPFLTVIDSGLIAGMGYNGRGVGMGTVMGRVLAQMAIRGDDHDPPFPVTTPQAFRFQALHPLGVWVRNLWSRVADRMEER